MQTPYIQCQQPDSTNMIAKIIDNENVDVVIDKDKKHIIWVWNNANSIPAEAYGKHIGKPYEIRKISHAAAGIHELKKSEPDCVHVVYHYYR